jgi:aminoglycoside/choline kinase family phosphotransferase
LSDDLGLSISGLVPASEDASFRRYFRVQPGEGPSLVVMDAPPDREDCGPFVAIAQRLAAVGLHVPAIHAADLDLGFVLLEDLGAIPYLQALDDATVDALYGDATRALRTMQREVASDGLPPYDRALLQTEMALFTDWLLGRHLGLDLSDEERRILEQTFELLVDNALEQPVVCVHRDYHSRNLMVVDANNPGIIDFQDAVAGPVTYDLVSLLRDCYIAWPPERVDAWVDAYAAGAPGVDRATFRRWFDRMGVQRHLKAAGIFARLRHRDGKPGYLADIPRTLGYIVEVAGRDAAVRPLGAFIAGRVLPVLARMPVA